ncbi:MAG: S16 family serine protease [Nanoarchaeota archaeon]
MANKDEKPVSIGELDAKYALPLHDTGKGEGERGIYRRVDADELGFKTTKDIPEPQGLERIVGQKEQVKAIMEGLAIKDPSFNILVWGGAENDINGIIRLTAEEYAKTAKVENVDQIAWQNFNNPLDVNVASVPAGYGMGLRKTMESVLSQIANYVPDATKVPDYFREMQAMNSDSMLREKEIRKTAIEVMARQGIPVALNDKTFCFDETKKVFITPKQKAKAEAYVISVREYITHKTSPIDEEIKAFKKEAGAELNSDDNFKKLNALQEKKITLEQEIRQSAVRHLLKTGVQAKVVGNSISISESYDAKKKIPEEKKHIASAYLITVQEQIKEISSQYETKKKKIESECKKADMRMLIESAYIRLLQQYEQAITCDAIHFEPIRQYLAEVFNHLMENPEAVMSKKTILGSRDADLEELLPNVLVDNSGNQGVIMLEETSPDPFGLIGSVEPDISKTRPYHSKLNAGDIVKANKGIVAINHADLVFAPMGMMKYALLKVFENGKLDIGDVAMHDPGLKAECDADVKFMVGVAGLGKQLSTWEDNEHLTKYFKKRIMLEREIDYTPENIMEIAKAVKLETLENREKLPEFSGEAVARIVEYLLKDFGKEKIKLDLDFCKELAVRAGINVRNNGNAVAGSLDIDAAYHGWKGEKDFFQRMYRELYKDKHFIIGEEPEVGVVNGLAVLGSSDISFGNVLRIGVTVAPQKGGSGEFHNIDKSAGMTGKTFTKSFLQVSSMIRELYQKTDRQLHFNLETSISQCDGGIDGPSAGAAMSLACISALSGIPVQPNLFFTGGIDPKSGKVTPVGGINEKVMGVYYTCKDRGIKNAVAVIPDVNVSILQLVDEEVHNAVRSGEFKVYTHKQINETLEIGTRKNPEEVHGAVKQRLEEIQKIFEGKKKSVKKPKKKD